VAEGPRDRAEREVDDGSWLHGIVHILEGDMKNAQGWYRRAERAFPGMDAAPAEIAAARSVVERG